MRKIKKIENYINDVYLNGFRICYPLDDADKDVKDYFDMKEGEYIVPSPIKKYRIAIDNYRGECCIRKDLPKESVAIHVVRRIPRYVEYDYQRERYQREYDEPLKVKIGFEKDKDNKKFICSPVMDRTTEDKIILMYLNLFKNIFNVFEICNPEFEEFINIDSRTEWNILRPGHRLFEKENLVKYISDKQGKDSDYIERTYRPLLIKKYTSIAIGTDGFRGYYAFQYEGLPYVIMEKFELGNATYVFEASKWKDLTKFTKTEVMQRKLYVDRILHNDSWNVKINKYMNQVEDVRA